MAAKCSWMGRLKAAMQITQLVGDSRIEAADRIRRHLGQVRRNDAPRALHGELHQKRPRHSIAAVCEYANSGTIGSPSTAQNTTV